MCLLENSGSYKASQEVLTVQSDSSGLIWNGVKDLEVGLCGFPWLLFTLCCSLCGVVQLLCTMSDLLIFLRRCGFDKGRRAILGLVGDEIIHRKDGSDVTTSIAVVRCGPDSDDVVVVHELVALLYELMRASYEG